MRVKGMKPAVSWRIEGIAPLARESAREAARRAGLSLGEWLNAAIIDSATDALAQKPTGKGEESPRKLAEAIARLSERLEELVEARTAREAALADPDQQPAPAPEERSSDIDQAVAEIAARQRSLEGVTELDAASAHQPGDAQEAGTDEATAAAIDNEMVEAVA